MYDYEINLNEFNTEETNVIETHLYNYNDDYESVDENTIVVHCKSETEWNDLDNLITKIRQR